MVNNETWKEKLDNNDKAHLWDMEIMKYDQFKMVAKEQRKMRSITHEPCWDCRRIAKKLGLKV